MLNPESEHTAGVMAQLVIKIPQHATRTARTVIARVPDAAIRIRNPVLIVISRTIVAYTSCCGALLGVFVLLTIQRSGRVRPRQPITSFEIFNEPGLLISAASVAGAAILVFITLCFSRFLSRPKDHHYYNHLVQSKMQSVGTSCEVAVDVSNQRDRLSNAIENHEFFVVGPSECAGDLDLSMSLKSGRGLVVLGERAAKAITVEVRSNPLVSTNLTETERASSLEYSSSKERLTVCVTAGFDLLLALGLASYCSVSVHYLYSVPFWFSLAVSLNYWARASGFGRMVELAEPGRILVHGFYRTAIFCRDDTVVCVRETFGSPLCYIELLSSEHRHSFFCARASAAVLVLKWIFPRGPTQDALPGDEHGSPVGRHDSGAP